MTIELPIACSLEETEMEGRVRAWESLFTDALIERRATDGGVQLVLSSTSWPRARLHELIALESKCCAWMTFEISEAEDLTVDITASDESGQSAVRKMFLTTSPAATEIAAASAQRADRSKVDLP